MKTTTIALVLACATPLLAQPPQTVQDEYAVYDLQAPETASFRTVYEVSFTTAGATTVAALNVFTRNASGQWQLVAHHGSPVTASAEVPSDDDGDDDAPG